MIYNSKKKKIFVAMSGGVDSSVAATLLKKFIPSVAGQDYDVIGVFMKLWKSAEGGENKCCSGESERTARLVANKLKIPFYVFDFRREFKKQVVDYFLREYKLGRTPNPCVACNQKIKFGLLLKRVLALGADFLATGHYIKKVKNKLLIAKDAKKDQSYFLWTLNQKRLKHFLFPLGNYTKDEVKKMAVDLKLPSQLASQKESFDICFISTGGHNDFLKKYLRLKPGQIVTTDGKKIGKHQGLPLYTIGQRAGIGIGGIGPFYVVECDYKKNQLIVTSNSNDPKLFKKELIANEINWVAGHDPAQKNFLVKAKIRYGHKAETANIKKITSNKYKVIFKKPQRAITLGQSVVFYKNKELLGGGIIEKS